MQCKTKKKVHSDTGVCPRANSTLMKVSRESHASSSAVRRQKLEFEAAQLKAAIEIKELSERNQMAITKARIEKELVEKKLAMDLAELESKSRCSEQCSSASYKSKVENWLEKSVAEPGTSHDCNKVIVGGGEGRRNIDSDRVVMPPTTANETHRAIEELTNAIKNAVETSNSNTGDKVLLSRLATSKDLPVYSGDPLEWIQFREAFYESSRVCKYSDTENLWRLRKCLRGDAKDAAAALLMGASSPHDIIETLELRFGRPENVMRQVITQLKKLSPLPHSYHAEIVKFAIKIKNYVTTVTTLKQIDYLKSPELLTIVVSKLPTGLVNKWVEYLHENRMHTETPKLELLSKFLYGEAQKVAESGVSYIMYQNDFNKNKQQGKKHDQHSVLTSVKVNDPVTDGKCKFCKRNKHALPDCNQFKRAMRKDRWRFVRANKLCFKCLCARHPDKNECTAESCNVENCGGAHHQMLHWTKPEVARRETSAPPNDSATPDSADAAASELVSHTSTRAAQCHEVSVLKPKTKVLLKIVPVTIHGPRSSVTTHALLDDGATVTLIAADLADEVGLHGERVTMRASGAWDSELLCETEIIKCELSNSDGNKFELRARKLKELNLPLQLFTSNVNYCENISSYNNSIICDSNVKPKILIGQDNYDLIAPIVCKRYKPGGPYITQTLLGWCVHGAWQADYTGKRAERVNSIGSIEGAGGDEPAAAASEAATSCALSYSGKPAAHAYRVSSPSSGNAGASRTSYLDIHKCVDKSSCQSAVAKDTLTCSTDIDLNQLHDLIRCSFSLDSIGISNKPRQNIEELRAVNILNDSAELVDGQWWVNLPWKRDNLVMPDSYPVALKRLNSVERKMSSSSEYETRYRERIEHLIKNNYARQLTEAECRFDSKVDHVWYLPHFGVDNPNKRKLRLVFDAAAKSDDKSLNDFLLQGPDLLQSLYGIMFRFRENPIGVIGDIKDMFLRIKIHNNDQNALRFLWKEKNSDVVNKYVMTSLIFGANCSPFIAQFINQNKNASRFSQLMPDAVEAIKKNQYMDDYIDSFSDKEVARNIIKEISFIHNQGGFKMCNYLSNIPDVLSDVPKDSLNDMSITFNFDKQPERALGILWFPRSDMLALDLSFKRIPQDIILRKRIPTKREMLSIIMSIFDIHGYLGPFTIKGKILMRETWKHDIKWDEKLNDSLCDLFYKWMNQAQEINNIKIPRYYFSSDKTSDSLVSLELHLFCDASPSAYAAVAYWRRESRQWTSYCSVYRE